MISLKQIRNYSESLGEMMSEAVLIGMIDICSKTDDYEVEMFYIYG